MLRIGTEFWSSNYVSLSNLATLPVTCGNGVCDSGETATLCPVDCDPVNCNALSAKESSDN